MTELEKIERAKMYMEKLANGINPIDDKMAPDEDIINQVRLSRCFFFVADVLRQVVENGGIHPSPPRKSLQKIPFELSHEARNAFVFSDSPISVSEIAKRINALTANEAMQRLPYGKITAWLTEAGFLHQTTLPSGSKTKRPTTEGSKIGISVEERTGAQGTYQVVLYDKNAQHFIIDHLDAIIATEVPTRKA